MRTKFLLAALAGGTLCGVLTLMRVTAADDPIHSLSEPQQKLFIDSLITECPHSAAQCKPCKDQFTSDKTQCAPYQEHCHSNTVQQPTRKTWQQSSDEACERLNAQLAQLPGRDCFPQRSTQAGTPVMIDLPELMGPMDQSLVETMKRKLGINPLAGSIFAAESCFPAMPPVPLLDGEAIHFPYKQVTAVCDDNDCPGARAPFDNTALQAVPGYMATSTTPDHVRLLRQSSVSMEEVANKLESEELYEQADMIRATAQQLRHSARAMRGGHSPVAGPWTPSPWRPSTVSAGPMPQAMVVPHAAAPGMPVVFPYYPQPVTNPPCYISAEVSPFPTPTMFGNGQIAAPKAVNTTWTCPIDMTIEAVKKFHGCVGDKCEKPVDEAKASDESKPDQETQPQSNSDSGKSGTLSTADEDRIFSFFIGISR